MSAPVEPMVASAGLARVWMVRSGSNPDRVYTVARFTRDGRWSCSGYGLPEHCRLPKVCWHVRWIARSVASTQPIHSLAGRGSSNGDAS